MNLQWGSVFFLWSPACFDLAGYVQLPFPYHHPSGAGVAVETIGDTEDFDGFLDEQLTGVFLRDGFGPLKIQQHVCVPAGGHEFCDPDVGGNSGFDPPVVTQATSATSEDLELTGSGTRTFYASVSEADKNCASAGQVVTDLSLGVFCVECPDGSFFDPASDQCATCSAGELHYTTEAVGARPRFLVKGLQVAECRSCPAQDPGLVARGQMPWILTSDGAFCTRCTDGSRQVQCAHDQDCGVLGNDEDFRCAGAPAWNGRANAPTAGACVPKCTSNADCPSGLCDRSDQDGDGHPDGICRELGTGQEVVAGMVLGCRPIGCDECWHNDYCDPTDASTCPLNHVCVQDPTLSPLCIARPLLSPAVEDDISPLFPDDRRDQIIANLHAVRDQLIQTMQTARLPDTLGLGDVPIFADVATDFDAEIKHVSIDLADPFPFVTPPQAQQGQIRLRIDLKDGYATVSGLPLNIGDFSITFYYEPHVRERSDAEASSGPGYAGIDATLVAVKVEGGVDIPLLPFGKISLSSAGDSLLDQLGPFANQLVSGILGILGAVEQDGHPDFARCLFVPDTSDGTQDLPRLCPDGKYEEPQLVKVTDGDIEITLRGCP